jgi:hypothetical protein
MGHTRSRTLAIAIVAVALSATLSGHHSFAAYYFEDQMIEIEGAVSEVEFKAPHVWLHVAAKDASGKERKYSAEWANPTRLERDGMTKDTLKIDDTVHVWGSPSRNATDNKLHLKRIQRLSDGWEWGMGRRGPR